MVRYTTRVLTPAGRVSDTMANTGLILDTSEW